MLAQHHDEETTGSRPRGQQFYTETPSNSIVQPEKQLRRPMISSYLVRIVIKFVDDLVST
jgi:hypothetical protein